MRTSSDHPTGAPLPLRTLIRLAQPLARAIRLDRGALEEGAERATGLCDWGDPTFRDGLDRFLASADGDARLNLVGRIAAKRGVASFLRSRLQFVHACEQTPTALRAPPRSPLVIAAMPRTGSSLLQQLLAAHPDALSIPLWLGLDPLPAPDDAELQRGGSPRRRSAALRTEWLVRTFEPAMMTKHPVGPDLPVECAYFMMSTFQALQWWALFPVYAYAEWFEAQDARPAYAVFRAHLQLVQERLRGSHWVLKSPGHFLRLEALLETVPEARVVRLHRDPVEVLASTGSLFGTAHGLMSDQVDHGRAAAINRSALSAAADRAVVLRCAPRQVMDVRYEDLVARPLDVVRAIHAWAGIRHDDDVEHAIAARLREASRARPGVHRYRTEAHVDLDATRAQFAAYTETFVASPVEARRVQA